MFWLACAIVTAVSQRHLFVVPPRAHQNRGAPLPALVRVRVGLIVEQYYALGVPQRLPFVGWRAFVVLLPRATALC